MLPGSHRHLAGTLHLCHLRVTRIRALLAFAILLLARFTTRAASTQPSVDVMCVRGHEMSQTKGNHPT